MEIFKGFAHRGQLVNNSLHEVNKVGEISSDAISFRREKKHFSSGNFVNLTLIGFTQTKNNEEYVLPAATQTTILRACDYVYTQSSLGAITADRESFQHAFIQQFGTTLDLIGSGQHVAYGNNLFCPEYIVIAPLNKSTTVQWKIWFSDESFRNQYDDYEILVSTPIVELDSFFDTAEAVTGLVIPADMQGINDRADQAKGAYPYTALRTWNFDWHDPSNSKVRIPTFWVTIHYGEAGNNSDSAKEALRDHILANSKRSREDWAKIFPDIFTSTEFIIIPAFMNVAVPNKARENGVYSPVITPDEIDKLATRLPKGVGYTAAHNRATAQATTLIYRSIAIVVVGGPENRDGINTLRKRYPDYITVPTTHVDFGYMKEETRNFVLTLVNLVRLADELTPSTTVPKGYNRIVRDGVTYVATSFANFLYLVPSKESVLKEIE